MAGGAAAPTIPQPIFTGERRRVNTHASLGNVGRLRFPHPVTSPSRSPASEEVPGSNEEDPGFLEFVVNTWSREFGMKASLKSVALTITGTEGMLTPKLPLTFLVSWMCALQLYREPNKQFMDLGRIIPRAFRMQIMIKSDPSVPTQKLRARLHTAFYEDDTFARVAQPFVDRRGTRSLLLRCRLCHDYGHDASNCNVRPKRGFPNYKRTSKNGKGAAHRL
ncbi:hypothetical protein TcYC6_0109760 [Trypanosoma cruzi]|nr:hypothetical protein TcYC6_0109760 [Trypanosoma cruzi]